MPGCSRRRSIVVRLITGPKQFQVDIQKQRRPIKCGAVEVALLVRKRLEDVPVQAADTRRGTIMVSTAQRRRGLSQVTTALAEPAQNINDEKLAVAAAAAPGAQGLSQADPSKLSFRPGNRGHLPPI